MHKKSIILVIGFKNSIIFIFPIVKMSAKYAKIDRVGSLNEDFQQVPLVQTFWNFPNIVMEHQWFNEWRNAKKKK